MGTNEDFPHIFIWPKSLNVKGKEWFLVTRNVSGDYSVRKTVGHAWKHRPKSSISQTVYGEVGGFNDEGGGERATLPSTTMDKRQTFDDIYKF